MKYLTLILSMLLLTNIAKAEHSVTSDAALTEYLKGSGLMDTFKCGDEIEMLESDCTFQLSMGCSSGCQVPPNWTPRTWKVNCDGSQTKVLLSVPSRYFTDGVDVNVDTAKYTKQSGNAAALIWSSFFNPKYTYVSRLSMGTDSSYTFLDSAGASKTVNAKTVNGSLTKYYAGSYVGDADLEMVVSNEVSGIARLLEVSVCNAPIFRLNKVIK